MDLLQDVENLYDEHFGRREPIRGEEIADSEADDSGPEENENLNIHTTERLRQYSSNIGNESYISHSSDVQNPDLAELSPDDYIEKIKNVYEKGCASNKDCLKQFTLQDISDNIYKLKEMSKSEKEMLIMGSLNTSGTIDSFSKDGKRKRIRYSFSFNGNPICRECFKICFDIGEKCFRNLKAHLDQNGAVPREHGNTGRRPWHSIKYEDSKRIVDFLIGFADEFGLPQPSAPRGRDEDPPIFLSSTETILKLHEKYKTAVTEQGFRVLGISSFREIWKSCCPHIKISGPKEDVCAKCEKYKQLIIDSTTEEDKLKYSDEFKKHIEASINERGVYKLCIQNAVDKLHNVIRPPGPVTALSTEYRHVHYTFDFSQHFTLPHKCRQIGALYFVTARKIHMFGVRVDGIPIQYNYLIDEDQTIGKDGAQTHGPNAVISMLHHALTNYGYGEQECCLHADNCSGQNKNMYLMGYFCWRVMTGLHKSIKYMMQIPGHARCLIDAGFAHSKKLYRRSDTDIIQDIAKVVNESAFSNVAVLKYDEDGESTWQWRDWKTFLSNIYRKLPKIREYQHFRFSNDFPGYVYVKKHRDDEELQIDLLKSRKNTLNVMELPLPSVIADAGFSHERKKYLFRSLRKYVRTVNQDTFCASETVDEE